MPQERKTKGSETPAYIYEFLSSYFMQSRPSNLGQTAEGRACTVQEVRPDNPFANPRFPRRDTTHIIYPECSSASTNEGVDIPASPGSQRPFFRLRESIRQTFRNSPPLPRPRLSKKLKAFVVDHMCRSSEIEKEWLETVNQMSCDCEVETDGDWTVIEMVSDDSFDNDDFCPLELMADDLQPKIDFSLNIPISDVRKGRKIGEGAFGQVYRAMYKNRLVVMKEVAPHQYENLSGQRFIESLKSELHVLGFLGRHPNVLECYGGSLMAPNVFMLCQLMDKTLADLIYFGPDGPKPLSVETALLITYDIASGLQHLHDNSPRVVHRDLKPENILLNKKNRACVADFGLSRTKSHTYINTENTHAGTPEYLAPEVATGKITEKMDIYSVGVILWECFMAQRPWEGYHPFAIFLNVSNGQRLTLPESVFPLSDNKDGFNVMFHIRKLIERCWWTADSRPDCAALKDEIEDILLELYNYGQ